MTANATPKSPYRAPIVRRYAEAGWDRVFPIGYRNNTDPERLSKRPPVEGMTGHAARVPTKADHKKWCREYPMANIGLHMGHEKIGIDVDQYGPKHGLDAIRALEERAGVKFPPTLRLTSRGGKFEDSGGKLIYRLKPEHQDLEWPGTVGLDTEILQFHHRYAMTYPSLNPLSGFSRVRWYRNNDTPVRAPEIPHADECAYLPDELVAAITSLKPREAVLSAEMTSDDIEVFLDSRPEPEGEPCSIMRRALDKAVDDLAGGHEEMRDGLLHLVALSSEGHRGIRTVLDEYRRAWLVEVTREVEGGGFAHATSMDSDPMRAYGRALTGGIKRVVGEHGDVACIPCSCDGNDWAGEDRQLAVPFETDEWDPAYTLDDYGACQRFVDAWRGSVVWMAEREEWYVWQEDDDTAGWTNKDALYEVRKRLNYVAGLWRAEAAELKAKADRLGEEGESGESKKLLAQSKAISKQAANLGFSARVSAVLGFVAEHPAVRRCEDDFDTNPRLFVCPNGTVDLLEDGAVFRRTAPSDQTIKVSATNYNPAALGQSTLWRSYLDSFIKDPEVRSYVQEVLGYGLLGSNPERLMVFLLGKTSSGKSTINEMITATLGRSYSGAVGMNVFRGNQDERGRADIMDAFPLHIVTAAETSAAWNLHADQMKRMVGEDTIPARRPYGKKIIQARMKFLPVIATNSAPRMAGFDRAMVRRLVVIPFNEEVAQQKESAVDGQVVQDTRAAEHMRNDQEAREDFLAWLVEGYTRYARRGSMPEAPVAVLLAKEHFVSGVSSVQDFIGECCELDSPNDAITRVTDLYEVYKLHHGKFGDPQEKHVSLKVFSEEVGSMPGIESARPKIPGTENRIKVKKGIRITEEWINIAQGSALDIKGWG